MMWTVIDLSSGGIGTVVRATGAEGSAGRARTSAARKLIGIGTACIDTLGAHTLCRLRPPLPRDHLWTMPRLE